MLAEQTQGYWAEWADVLSRLDQRLRIATEAKASGHEPAAGEADVLLERFAGLYLDPDEVRRLLDRPPGQYGVNEKTKAGALEPLTKDVPSRSRLSRLFHALDLDPFEADVLVLAAAVEIDPKYEKIYAAIQDDVTRKRPTVGLALALLCDDPADRLARLKTFGASGRLARFGLVELISDASGPPAPLPSRTLRLDEGVLRHLAGEHAGWSRLEALAPAEPAPTQVGKNEDELEGLQPLIAAVGRARAAGEPARILLIGPRGVGKSAATRALADHLKLERLPIDLARVADAAPSAIHALGKTLARETRLRPSLIHLIANDPAHATALKAERPGSPPRAHRHPMEEQGGASGEVAEGGSPMRGGVVHALEEFARSLRGLPARSVVVLETTARGATARRLAQQSAMEGQVVVELGDPPVSSRRDAWREALRSRGLEDALESDEQDRLARMFRLGYGSIHAAARDAALSGRGGEAVWEAARHRAADALGDLAERIEPHADWEDLVVTSEIREQLEDVVRRAEYRDRVMTDWGFGERLGHGKGTNALFAGPPGTGKTLAAEVLASRLGLPLFRVDSSAVVSKYIGETEKNLERIFQAAEDCDAVLFFDEADAIFGKRTEVQDAHDRYANMETAYLLQRAERHDGLVLLATNLIANMDPAFTRRLAHVIHFTPPDVERRRAIWFRIWPDSLPLAADVDLGLLASRFAITGGSIKNAALGAAYLAASEHDPDRRRVTMAHVLTALGHEYRKMGKHPEEVFSAHDRDKARVRLN